MGELLNALRQELSLTNNELEQIKIQPINQQEIEEKVQLYRQELVEKSEIDNQILVSQKEQEIEALNRLIAKEEAKFGETQY